MDAISELETKETYIQKFLEDGVSVFRNKIDAKKLQSLRIEINKIREKVIAKIETMSRPLRTYSDIAERYPGRLDLRCGFTAPIFEEVAGPIIQLVEALSPSVDFRYYWGAIPSMGGSGPTNMHRDIYPLLNNADDENLSSLELELPPYYFTVLIPLVEITPINGPTTFIKGSNQRVEVDESKEEIFAPLLSPGDFVVFDGRTLHKGSANKARDERLIAYITFTAKWYHDQTFNINDYLFPELAVKGR